MRACSLLLTLLWTASVCAQPAGIAYESQREFAASPYIALNTTANGGANFDPITAVDPAPGPAAAPTLPNLPNAAGACGTDPYNIGGCKVAPPVVWTATMEGLQLWRTQPFEGVIVVDDSNFPAPAITGRQLEFDPEVGPRVTLQRVGRLGTELSYFGFHNWSAMATNIGMNDRSLPNPLGVSTFDFFAADRIDAAYSSEIHSAEASLIRPLLPRVSLLGGVRFLSLDETLNLHGVDSNSGESDYLINTQNRLIGGQLGGRYHLGTPQSIWSGAATAKAGVYNNNTKQRTSLQDLNNTVVLRNFNVSDTETSFVGEINLLARLRLTRSCHIVGGYNFIWIEQLALAPQQLDFTDTPTSGSDLRETPGLFLHGASLGLGIDF